MGKCTRKHQLKLTQNDSKYGVYLKLNRDLNQNKRHYSIVKNKTIYQNLN